MAVEHAPVPSSSDLNGHSDLGAHRHLVVSERLRLRRRELGLTQKEVVARLRRIGVCSTNKALSSLEHGAGLDVAKLPELAQALDCSLTYLVGLTEHPHRWEPDDGSGERPGSADSTPAGEPPPAPPGPAGAAGDREEARTTPDPWVARDPTAAPPPIIGPVGDTE